MSWLDFYDLALDWIFKIHHFTNNVWSFLMKEYNFSAFGLGTTTVFECLFMFGVSSLLTAKFVAIIRNTAGF